MDRKQAEELFEVVKRLLIISHETVDISTKSELININQELINLLNEVYSTILQDIYKKDVEDSYENTGEWYAKLDSIGPITMLEEYVPSTKSYIEIDEDGINFVKDSKVYFRIDQKGFRPVKDCKCSCKGENN